MSNLSEASAKIQKARQELKEFAESQGAEAIGAAFAPLFEKFPDVEYVQWEQYTPYFNDGEPCTFIVCEPYAYDGGDDEISDERVNDMLGEICSQCDEDLLYLCFGDHVQIKITSEGVEVDDYNHD